MGHEHDTPSEREQRLQEVLVACLFTVIHLVAVNVDLEAAFVHRRQSYVGLGDVSIG